MNILYDGNLLDSLNDVFWSCSPSDFSFYFINKACEQVYGYSPEDFYKDKQLWFSLLLKKEDRESVIKHLKNTLAKGKNEVNYRIRHKDGSIRYIYDKTSIVYDEDGTPKAINGIAVDVTNLQKALNKNKKSKKKIKQQDKKIQEQEQNLLGLINNTTDGIWSIDKDFKLISGNKTFINSVKQLTQDDIKTGDSVLFEEYGKDKLAIRKKSYERAFKGEVVFWEDIVELPEVGEICVEASFRPIRDEKDNITSVSCLARDVTARKNAEKEIELQNKKIQEQEQNLLGLINNTTDIIWSVSKDFTLISANEPFINIVKQFTQYRIQEGDSLLLKEYGEKKLAMWKDCYQRALGGEILFLEDVEDYPAVGKIYVETNLCPIRDEKGNITSIGCLARDVTARKNAEAKLKLQNEAYLALSEEYKTTNEELQEKNSVLKIQNDALNEVAWIQSHEMRRPVANILGLIALFDMKNPYEPFNSEIIGKMLIVAEDLDVVIHKVVKKAGEVHQIAESYRK